MPRIVSTVADMQHCADEWRSAGQAIGFVPTMGNLHRGHLKLVEAAKARADKVVVSIFVNPMQFGPNEDFLEYPRTQQQDIQQLEALAVDAVFTPDENIIYPAGLAGSSFVEVPALTDTLEGASRPGHFRGVATVVSILFNIVRPQIAVFGEKDFQQLLVIRKLARDLHYPIEIVGVETVREDDGLALSSRNRRLSPEQRRQARALPDALAAMAEQLRGGNVEYRQLEQQVTERLQRAGFEVDYIVARSAEDLGLPQPGRELVVLGAARLGATRLLDAHRV